MSPATLQQNLSGPPPEGARAGILTHRDRWGSGQGGAAVRLERKGWILKTPGGKNLEGLVEDWIGNVWRKA